MICDTLPCLPKTLQRLPVSVAFIKFDGVARVVEGEPVELWRVLNVPAHDGEQRPDPILILEFIFN